MATPVTGEEYEQRFASFMELVLSGEVPETNTCCAVCLTDSFDTIYCSDPDVRRAGINTGGVLCGSCYDKYVDAV